MLFDKKTILITGGTGSLGKVLTRRLLSGEKGTPKKIIIFSRDEAKQHFMRLEYQNKKIATDEVIYNNFKQILEFHIGDIRDYHSVVGVLKNVDIVINAAALKQVPSCEYFPEESLKTNTIGPSNIVKAIHEYSLPIDVVVGVSTDKACKPVNVMGMTKALQERIFITANISSPKTKFLCVRYGNVLASRGSVIPLFLYQIENGGPITITTKKMTRFFLSLNEAVDTIFAAIKNGKAGETYVPKINSARMIDLAKALIGSKKIKTKFIGIRPGEKIHEVLISEEEAYRTLERKGYYVIQSLFPEVSKKLTTPALKGEYSSSGPLMSIKEIYNLIKEHDLPKANRQNTSKEILK